MIALPAISASADNIKQDGFNSVRKVLLVGGSTAATVTLFDGTQAGGRDMLSLAAAAGSTATFTVDAGDDFAFKTSVSATLAGTGAKLYIYID